MPFYFYDLETSGFNPRTSRIMQFGGVLTDENLKISDEWQTYIKLSDDILPEPDAVMLTGITPQKTQEEGLSEPEFLAEFSRRALKKDAVITGFNSIRFDDEFMRFTLWRNFYDPYEWQWKDGRSRWDILDVMRMTRALRPKGIEWPKESGKPTNRLELLAKANNIPHDAHDALADAKATVQLARLVKKHNPKLFNYLLSVRTKDAVLELISPRKPKPFVYSSGRYSSEHEKTTVAVVLGPHPSKPSSFLVYDLRFNPDDFKDWDLEKITKHSFLSWKERQESELEIEEFPVKSLQINRAPAVAPLGVLDKSAEKRIQLQTKEALENFKKLSKLSGFGQKVHEAWKKEEDRFTSYPDPEMSMYDGFISDNDRKMVSDVRNLNPGEISRLDNPFKDKRLNQLIYRYLARNFPDSLSQEAKAKWEKYRLKRLGEGIGGSMTFGRFFTRLQQISQKAKLSDHEMFLLEELKLYGESIAPEFED